ncbi:ABC transporter ATP-binding protein [Ilumatobacter sp.]|uniref:ABC transporter ATP-binding protein n=1 Tax=Ilumatobacter sp. TaxID=1967498 RepID=UPI003B51A47A
MDDVLVRARGLTKTYADLEAVRGIDFDVRRGELFGFLGPNGAGKSTTMRMIGTTTPRTGGELHVLGREPATDAREIKARLGVVPQEDSLDTELTVAQNLHVYGRYFGLGRDVIRERSAELLDFVQLADRADRAVDTLSGGMQRRLTIARGLINDPEMVILDEPTTGLDPQARHVLWERLTQLRARGVTLLLTTHYMDEAEQLCDRLVVLHEGRIIAEGSPRELIRTHVARDVVELRFDRVAPAHDAIAVAVGDRARGIEVVTDRALVSTDDADGVVAAVDASDLGHIGALTRRATLEDVFLALTGRQLLE